MALPACAYTVSSRSVQATGGDPVSKNQKEKEKRKEDYISIVVDKYCCGGILLVVLLLAPPLFGYQSRRSLSQSPHHHHHHHHFCIHCMATKLCLTSNSGLGGSFQGKERWETPMFQTGCTGFDALTVLIN